MSDPQAAQDPALYQPGYLYGYGSQNHSGPAAFGTYGELQGVVTQDNPYGTTHYNPAPRSQPGGAGVHLSDLELIITSFFSFKDNV